jgi:chromosome segregation ATPase
MEAWLEKNKIESQESLDSQGMNATFFKGLIESAQEKKKCWCCRHIMNDAEFAAFNARLNKAMKVDPEEQKADEEHLEKTKSVLLECQVLKREAAVVDELFTKVGGFENEMGDLEGEIARVQVTAASAAEALAGCASTRQTVVELEEEVNKVGSEFQELSRRKEEANERMERLQSQVTTTMRCACACYSRGWFEWMGEGRCSCSCRLISL